MAVTIDIHDKHDHERVPSKYGSTLDGIAESRSYSWTSDDNGRILIGLQFSVGGHSYTLSCMTPEFANWLADQLHAAALEAISVEVQK